MIPWPVSRRALDAEVERQAPVAADGLDPRWEWIEARRLCDVAPTYFKGRCLHAEVVPVESAGGETVAHLCLTCDTQLPREWQP